jgi:hypothetical protein
VGDLDTFQETGESRTFKLCQYNGDGHIIRVFQECYYICICSANLKNVTDRRDFYFAFLFMLLQK